MTGAGARRKGIKFEREIARQLRRRWIGAHRGRQERFGHDACDVENTPFWIECKRERRVNIQRAMEQAQAATLAHFEQLVRNCPDDSQVKPPRAPVVISQDDYGEILVTLRLEDWL